MNAIISKPMLFSGANIPRLEDGSKTQTRRILKPQPSPGFLKRGVVDIVPQWPHQDGVRWFMADGCSELLKCPHPIGSRIWVKETFGVIDMTGPPVFYRADNPKDYPDDGVWKPSIFMPRKFSRITLEVTGVRVERLNAISPADAIAEGIEVTEITDVYSLSGGKTGEKRTHYKFYGKELERLNQQTSNPVWSYETLWESINGKGSWSLNPWVWAYTFRRIKP